MSKSRDAFRTISEVAEWLDTPAHVLRFWESKFTQVKPVKRAGGRRYYRPADMELLGGIKTLLHSEGMTIKGVQKVLREQGVRHVASLSADVVDTENDASRHDAIDEAPFADVPEPDDIVVPFAQRGSARDRAKTPPDDAPQSVPQESLEPLAVDDTAANAPSDSAADAPSGPAEEGLPGPSDDTASVPVEAKDDSEPLEDSSGDSDSFADSPVPDFLQDPMMPGEDATVPVAADQLDTAPKATPMEADEPLTDPVAVDIPDSAPQDPDHPDQTPVAPEVSEPDEQEDEQQHEAPVAAKDAPPLPDDPDLGAILTAPGCLSHLSRITRLTVAQRQAIAPLAAQLRTHRHAARQDPQTHGVPGNS